LKTFGETLRQLRESKGLLLRQAAAELEIDTALLSKIERGDRNLKREQVLQVAAFYGIPENELLILWLSEKVDDLLTGEPLALEALNRSLKNFKTR
jgi:transcriptional regulator with XRE-family HTH domain